MRRLLAAFLLSLAAGAAHAETRGLILAIADYPGAAALPGVKNDVPLARKLAKWMRVPDHALTVIQDGALQLDGFRRSLQAFADSVQPGDDIFLYYSGHGGRLEVKKDDARPQCAESFIAADLQFFMDRDFKFWLEQLSARASKVVVFADSCHSGGVAEQKLTRSFGEKLLPKTLAKAEPGEAGRCEPVNLAKTIVMTRALRSNAVYIAAARDNEVAWSTSRGSSASMAWTTCLDRPDTDRDGSGGVTAEELRQCAQGWLDEKGYNQHLHVVGNNQVVLGFDGGSATLGQASMPAPALQPAAVFGGLLENLAASGDPKRSVRVIPVRGRVAIGRDSVELDVVTAEPGYLYLLYLGSDGKTLDLLYPNKLDTDNYLQPGSHRFPRAAWRLTAGGPPGTDRILAIVSPTRRNFARLATGELGPFSLLLDANRPYAGARNLMIESLRPDTPLAGDCATRNLRVVADQRDCVTAYGVGMAWIEEVR